MKRRNSGRITRWPEVKPFGGTGPFNEPLTSCGFEQAASGHVDGNDIHVANEFRHEAGGGRTVDFMGAAHLHELAFAHDANPVAHHHRLFQRMGDVDEGFLRLAVNVLQFLFQRLAQLVVDGRQGLVEEQDLRVIGQGPGQGHALALAAGTFHHVLAVVGLRQAQKIHQFEGAHLALVLGFDPLIFRENSIFSPTVRCGNRASDWNTMQVGRRLAGRSLIRSPRRRMSPLVGCSMPASMRSSVVLPDPEGPTMVKNSPSPISRSMLSTAAKRAENLANRFERKDSRAYSHG